MSVQEKAARVLAEHQIAWTGMTGTSPDTCACGAKIAPAESLRDYEDIFARRSRAFAAHQAVMLAAAGDVLRDEPCAECGGQGYTVRAVHHPACQGGCEQCPVPEQERCWCQQPPPEPSQAAQERPAGQGAPTGEGEDLLQLWALDGWEVDHGRREVLVDGSWLPAADLPRIMNNLYLSLQAAYRREKDAVLAALPSGDGPLREALLALADEWDEHAQRFTEQRDERTRQDWEYVAESLRALLAEEPRP